MKKLFIVLLPLFIYSSTWAQTEKLTRTWEVEIDPIAFFMKGYSGHVIYQPRHLRVDAGVFGIQQPESFHGNKGYELFTKGYGLKVSYLLQGTKGLYVGVGTGYTTNEAKHEESGSQETGHTVGLGTHVGYRFFLQKDVNGAPTGFYISPWISLDYNIHTDRIKFDGLEYKQNNWGYFPTVHIGYRF